MIPSIQSRVGILSFSIRACSQALVLLLISIYLPLSASAHHSTSMFDSDQTAVVTGVVLNIQLKNPHSMIYILTSDEEGNEVQWALEAEPMSTLTRNGWTSTTLKVGDTVTAYGGPARNGSPAMILRAIQLPDGRVMRT